MIIGEHYDTHFVTQPQRGLQTSSLRFRVHHATNLVVDFLWHSPECDLHDIGNYDEMGANIFLWGLLQVYDHIPACGIFGPALTIDQI